MLEGKHQMHIPYTINPFWTTNRT